MVRLYDDDDEVRLYDDEEVHQAHLNVFLHGRTLPGQCLPPGMSEPQFRDVVRSLEDIVGESNVYTGDSLLHFSDPFAFRQDKLPSAAVCPKSVEQITRILALANSRHFPLWTISRGKNLGYGGPSPRVAGSVILSLHRMGRILEVDEKSAYAVVEPGVTFLELYNHCRAAKLAVWPSVPAIAWGSVVGNTLDRGFGSTAFGDHHSHICGMEVVLADGDVVRTGQWAAEGSPSAFACKSQFGPQVDGLFLQSNLGVVAKLGIWLQPQPAATMAVCLEMSGLDDLGALVEVLGELRRQDVLQNDPSVFDVSRRICKLGPRHAVYRGPGAMPEELVARLMEQHGWHYWTAWFSFYGTAQAVGARLAATQAVLAAARTARPDTARLTHRLFEGGPDGDARVDAAAIPDEWQPMNAGVPTVKFASTLNYNTAPGGRGGHVDFAPILPYDGALALRWYRDAAGLCRAHGFDSFLGAHAFARHAVFVHMILFDRTRAGHVARADALWRALADKARGYGLVKYRTHLDYMDTVQSTYGFNDGAYRRFVERLKDALDPNGILSPGKSGIWPKQYRDGGLQNGTK